MASMLCICQTIRVCFHKRTKRQTSADQLSTPEKQSGQQPLNEGEDSMRSSGCTSDTLTPTNGHEPTESAPALNTIPPPSSAPPTQPICHISATFTPRMLASLLDPQHECPHPDEVVCDCLCSGKCSTWPLSKEMGHKMQEMLKLGDGFGKKNGMELEVGEMNGEEEDEDEPRSTESDESQYSAHNERHAGSPHELQCNLPVPSESENQTQTSQEPRTLGSIAEIHEPGVRERTEAAKRILAELSAGRYTGKYARGSWAARAAVEGTSAGQIVDGVGDDGIGMERDLKNNDRSEEVSISGSLLDEVNASGDSSD